MGQPRAIEVRVPGKAMLAGEYAVLSGAPALVCAVDRHLVCRRERAARFAIEGAGVRWSEGEREPEGLRFALEALRCARRYLTGRGLELAPCALWLEDALRAPGGAKLGLGGSAATCVAVVAAALAGSGLETGRGRVCLLAATAHAAAQANPGSGADVAASCYGGTLWLHRLEVERLVAARAAEPATFAGAVDGHGRPPVEPIENPFASALVFAGRSASTSDLVARVEAFARADPREYERFLDASRAACEQLRDAMDGQDLAAALAAVTRSETALDSLGAAARVPIVVDEHWALAAEARRYGLAAKPSGAGGGDCSLVLGAETEVEAFVAAMRRSGRYALRARPAAGVSIGSVED